MATLCRAGLSQNGYGYCEMNGSLKVIVEKMIKVASIKRALSIKSAEIDAPPQTATLHARVQSRWTRCGPVA